MANGAWLPTVQLVDLGGNVISGGGSGTLSPLTGDVDTVVTASLPAGVIGTIQFTRTMRTAPFTKTAIAGAVASNVNTLTYTIATADAGCNVGYDVSSEVSSSATIPVPTAPIVVPLLRVATPYNRVATSVAQSGAGKTIRLSTVKNCTTGSGDLASLVVKYDNLFLSAGGAAIQGPGNSVKIIGMQIGIDGLTGMMDVTFGGETSIDVADFQYNVLSDTILPSLFGLSVIPQGSSVFVTSTIEVTGGQIPQLEGTDTFVEGVIYDPAVTTLNFTSPFPPTTSGAPSLGQSGGSSVSLLGTYASGDPHTWMLDGDSLFAQGFQMSYGVGAMLVGDKVSAFQVGRVGGAQTTTLGYKDLYKDCWLQYCRGVINEYGTNTIIGDLTSDTANLQGFSLEAWAFFRANSNKHPLAGSFNLVRLSLLQRTSGSFGDTSSQTVQGGWGAGQSAEVFDDWCASQVGVGNGPDHYFDPNVGSHGTTRAGATRSDPDYYKWAANLTIDGLHNDTEGREILAPNLREQLNTIGA